jgi:hypothetical protein
VAILACPGLRNHVTFVAGDGRLVRNALLAIAIVAMGVLAPAAEGATVSRRVAAPSPGLRPQVFALALKAYARARSLGQTASSIVTLIDYSLPSTEKRLWVVDVARGALLFNELVAHGRHTGDNLARAFSNLPGSEQSSLGAFVTGETYEGKHGLSLRLKGLEPGINDRAEERAIVMHAAPYVNEVFARIRGRLGRSQGCPAVRPEVAPRIIETIKDGTFLFAYYPDPEIQRTSAYLN